MDSCNKNKKYRYHNSQKSFYPLDFQPMKIFAHRSIFELNKRTGRPISRLGHVLDLVPLVPVEHPSSGKLNSAAEFFGLTFRFRHLQFPGVNFVVRFGIGVTFVFVIGLGFGFCFCLVFWFCFGNCLGYGIGSGIGNRNIVRGSSRNSSSPRNDVD